MLCQVRFCGLQPDITPGPVTLGTQRGVWGGLLCLRDADVNNYEYIKVDLPFLDITGTVHGVNVSFNVTNDGA